MTVTVSVGSRLRAGGPIDTRGGAQVLIPLSCHRQLESHVICEYFPRSRDLPKFPSKSAMIRSQLQTIKANKRLVWQRASQFKNMRLLQMQQQRDENEAAAYGSCCAVSILPIILTHGCP